MSVFSVFVLLSWEYNHIPSELLFSYYFYNRKYVFIK